MAWPEFTLVRVVLVDRDINFQVLRNVENFMII